MFPVSYKNIYSVIFTVIFLLSMRDMFAQPVTETDDNSTAKPASQKRYDERFRLILGFGRSQFKPGVLSEAGPAWMTNSFIASAIDTNASPVFSLSDPKNLQAWSLFFEADYTWKDRLTTGIKYYNINQDFRRKDPAMVDFILPPGIKNRWSYFEGVRLTKYQEENKSLYAKYLHKMWFRGFKAGIYLSREWYDELNDISFGSYVATTLSSSVAPGTTNWSQGGIVPSRYSMTGYSIGPSFRYQLFDWLGFHYELTSVRRAGNLSMQGIRLIQQSNDITGGTAYSVLLPAAAGRVKDSGLRHNLEIVFRIFCRYSLHIGILKEDFERNYDSYLGKTLSSGNLPFQEKTPVGMGIGEMNKAHKLGKIDIYMKFGTSFVF
jgi:hypothetical protein